MRSFAAEVRSAVVSNRSFDARNNRFLRREPPRLWCRPGLQDLLHDQVPALREGRSRPAAAHRPLPARRHRGAHRVREMCGVQAVRIDASLHDLLEGGAERAPPPALQPLPLHLLANSGRAGFPGRYRAPHTKRARLPRVLSEHVDAQRRLAAFPSPCPHDPQPQRATRGSPFPPR